MNTYKNLLLLCTISSFLLACKGKEEAPSTDGTVRIAWNEEKQTIDGFGVAQAGWADRLYAHQQREEVMNLMFGTDGLHLSILRGEVFPHYWETSSDKDFNLNDPIDLPITDPIITEKTDDRTRRGQLWVTKMAKEKFHVDKLFFSVWSAPAHMKTNGQVSQGELKESSFQDFADYLTAFYKAYSSIGLEPYAISPSNEPGYAAPWNSSLWTAGKMGQFITQYLGPTFEKEGVGAHIVFGENPFWSAVSSQADFVSSQHFVSTILTDYPEISKFHPIAAGHGYTLPDSYPAPKDSLKTPIVAFPLAEKAGIPVWLTEISDVTPLDTTLQDGVKWAATFHEFLTSANVSACIWWAGALPAGNNEGLIVLNEDNAGYRMTKRFYTFGNFSRYIPVGSKRIDATMDATGDSLLVSAYKQENDFTLVAINPSLNDRNVSLQMDGQQLSGTLNRYLTSETANWEPSAVEPDKKGCYILNIPAGTVATFTGKIK